MSSGAIEIRAARAAEVVELRHAVLRAGLPRETAIFAGDDDPRTLHFIAVLDGQVVGCVTLLPHPWENAPAENEPAWQLRGMAVEPGMQRAGIGARLLEAVEQAVQTSPTPLLWCNARVPASPFYQRHGWQVMSEPFDYPTAGPHVKMLKRLGR